MEPKIIPVRSRRQTMDWSLALASQGIEPIIRQSPEDGGWELVVEAGDYERALKTLRQYHLENRGWAWRQQLPWPQTHFDWGALGWAGLLVFIHWAADVYPRIESAGIMSSAGVFSGQWWRIFTAMMLHADLAHLATNLSLGIVLFGLAMGIYGTGTGLLAAYLAGAGGNVVSLLTHDKSLYGLGASGMVMGALGLLAAQSLRSSGRKGASPKYRWGGVTAGMMLFVLYGLAPGTDVAAHFGGFAAGLLLGAGLVYLPPGFCRNARVNVIAGIILAALVIVTWGLALKTKG